MYKLANKDNQDCWSVIKRKKIWAESAMNIMTNRTVNKNVWRHYHRVSTLSSYFSPRQRKKKKSNPSLRNKTNR